MLAWTCAQMCLLMDSFMLNTLGAHSVSGSECCSSKTSILLSQKILYTLRCCFNLFISLFYKGFLWLNDAQYICQCSVVIITLILYPIYRIFIFDLHFPTEMWSPSPRGLGRSPNKLSTRRRDGRERSELAVPKARVVKLVLYIKTLWTQPLKSHLIKSHEHHVNTGLGKCGCVWLAQG